MRAQTILNRPSMMAIKPPVLVPPIKSKYWQGRGVSSASLWRCISSMISLKIKSEDNPLTPPPSRDSNRGWCSIIDLLVFPTSCQQRHISFLPKVSFPDGLSSENVVCSDDRFSISSGFVGLMSTKTNQRSVESDNSPRILQL